MKRHIAIFTSILLAVSLAGCSQTYDNHSNDILDSISVETTVPKVTPADFEPEMTQQTKEEAVASKMDYQTVLVHGAFTATVDNIMQDNSSLIENTVAVVHEPQSRPFLLYFDGDVAEKLEVGETYVFAFEPFEIAIVNGKDNATFSEQIDMFSANLHIKDFYQSFGKENEERPVFEKIEAGEEPVWIITSYRKQWQMDNNIFHVAKENLVDPEELTDICLNAAWYDKVYGKFSPYSWTTVYDKDEWEKVMSERYLDAWQNW